MVPKSILKLLLNNTKDDRNNETRISIPHEIKKEIFSRLNSNIQKEFDNRERIRKSIWISSNDLPWWIISELFSKDLKELRSKINKYSNKNESKEINKIISESKNKILLKILYSDVCTITKFENNNVEYKNHMKKLKDKLDNMEYKRMTKNITHTSNVQLRDYVDTSLSYNSKKNPILAVVLAGAFTGGMVGSYLAPSGVANKVAGTAIGAVIVMVTEACLIVCSGFDLEKEKKERQSSLGKYKPINTMKKNN